MIPRTMENAVFVSGVIGLIAGLSCTLIGYKLQMREIQLCRGDLNMAGEERTRVTLDRSKIALGFTLLAMGGYFITARSYGTGDLTWFTLNATVTTAAATIGVVNTARLFLDVLKW